MKFSILPSSAAGVAATIITSVVLSLTPVSAQAESVTTLIAEAREAGSIRGPEVISSLAIELGLREIGPSGVSEAIAILQARSETEDVLAGLMRGLAIIHESTDPRISSTLCNYATDSMESVRLQMEARESLRIRCLEGRIDLGADMAACACLIPVS